MKRKENTGALSVFLQSDKIQKKKNSNIVVLLESTQD